MDTASEKELYFATSLSNPRVRAAVRGHLKDMDWSSPFAEKVCEYFLGLGDSEQYNKVALHGHLIHEFMETEIIQLLGRCLEHYRLYEKDEHGLTSNTVLTNFQKFYNRKVTTKLIRDFQHDPERLVEEIEQLQKMKFASLPLDVLGDLDVDKVIEEDLGNITYIPSAFPCVKESCYPYPGYSTGQVVMVCAPPGVGKTLFLAHEVVRMMQENLKIEKEEEKFKVYWLALGDMNRLDFIVRLTAIWKNVSFNEIKRSPKQYFDEEVRSAFKHVKITVVPAAYVDIYGVKYFVENTVCSPTFNPQVIIIDYDANLLSNRESMYATGEEVYNVASTIAKPVGKPGRLVFIASQPKIEFWNYCPMPKEAAAESSRKQAIIDMMITLARDPNSAQERRVGKMLIAKNRRGADGCVSLYRLQDGLFHNIDDNEYATSLESSSSGGNFNGAKRNNQKRRDNHQRYGSA